MKKLLYIFIPLVSLLVIYIVYSIYVGYQVRSVVMICNETKGKYTDELKGKIEARYIPELYFQDDLPVKESKKILKVSFPLVHFKSLEKADTTIYYTTNDSADIPVQIKLKKASGEWKIIYVYVSPY